MNWQQIRSIALPVIMIVYLLIIAYYLYLEFYALILIIKSLVIHRLAKSNQGLKDKQSKIIRSPSIKQLLTTSLFFNHTLAILTTFVLLIIIAELPINFKYKLGIIPVVATLIPYLWSYTRATSVGINGGILGVILGLFWLAWRDPNISLFHDAFYFIIINITSNISGWLGGWVGASQIKEGAVVNLFKVLINGDGSCLNQLVSKVQKAVNRVLKYDPSSARNKDIKFVNSRPVMRVAQKAQSFSVLSYRHELEWLKKSHPQKIAMGWLRENTYHSPNQVIDYIFNIFQNTVTKVIFLRFPEPLEKPKESVGENNLVEIYILVLQYKETPSIIWVNSEVELLSDLLNKEIFTVIPPTGKHDEKDCISPSWKLDDHQKVIMQNWQPKIRLEQYSKNTYGSSIPYQVMNKVQLTDEISLPAIIMNEIAANPSLFDKFKGKVSTFMAFLVFEASVAIIISLISSYLYDVIR